tara:strand:+ start:195 stop:497 length:303 start_codon:yes stop_codon:yes gene_type:complete
MKRFFSILFLTVFTFYLVAESSTYHYHSEVVESGIVEESPKEGECITCLISSSHSSDIGYYQFVKNYLSIYKESLVYFVNSVYRKLSILNLSSRAPPITL